MDLRLGSAAGLELRAVVAVAGDAGVGTGFSGSAHYVGKVVFGGWLLMRRLLLSFVGRDRLV